MITTLKTKKEVIYDTLKQLSDFIYLQVRSVNFDGNNFEAIIQYSVNQNDVFVPINIVSSSFSAEQAVFLQNTLSIPNSNLPTLFKNLVEAVSMYQVGQTGVFGLTADDWEIYEVN